MAVRSQIPVDADPDVYSTMAIYGEEFNGTSARRGYWNAARRHLNLSSENDDNRALHEAYRFALECQR
jgi:hypothetical protein